MRLAIILLYTTGIRRGELLRLTPRDYDSSAQTLLIRASKFHKSRLLPLPGDVAAEIAQFLQLHQSLRFPGQRERRFRRNGSDASLVKLVGWPPWLSPRPNFKAHLARALAADRMIYHGDAPPTDEQFQFRLPLVSSTMLQKSQRKPSASSGGMNLAPALSNA